MNPNLLSVMRPFMPDLILKASGRSSETTTETLPHNSYELVSDDGQIVGHVKAWWDEDDFAGFVRFDPEGNVVEWKCFKLSPNGRAVRPH